MSAMGLGYTLVCDKNKSNRFVLVVLSEARSSRITETLVVDVFSSVKQLAGFIAPCRDEMPFCSTLLRACCHGFFQICSLQCVCAVAAVAAAGLVCGACAAFAEASSHGLGWVQGRGLWG